MRIRKAKELCFKYPFEGGPADKVLTKTFPDLYGEQCDDELKLLVRTTLVGPLYMFAAWKLFSYAGEAFPNAGSTIGSLLAVIGFYGIIYIATAISVMILTFFALGLTGKLDE